jgi:hypothetical protein
MPLDATITGINQGNSKKVVKNANKWGTRD